MKLYKIENEGGQHHYVVAEEITGAIDLYMRKVLVQGDTSAQVLGEIRVISLINRSVIVVEGPSGTPSKNGPYR